MSSEYFFDIILGLPGTGKTTFGIWLASEYRKKKWQVFWHSPIDDRMPPGSKFIFDLSQFKPTGIPSILFIDELSFYLAPDSCDQELLKVIRARRHYKLSILGTSQCIMDIHIKVRKLVTRYYALPPLASQSLEWFVNRGKPFPEKKAKKHEVFYNEFNSAEWRKFR